MFKNRTTGEIMVLMVAVTVCGYVIIVGSIVLLLAFFTDRDLSNLAGNIGDIVNTLIGLLAGFLAGKTDVIAGKRGEKEDSEE
jgi:hypothetical protein